LDFTSLNILSFKKSEVLTVNGTIITGVLILLTVTNYVTSENTLLSSALDFYITVAILFTVIPFAVSSFIELRDAIKSNIQNELATKNGLRFMQYGFMYLLLLVLFITIGRSLPFLDNFK